MSSETGKQRACALAVKAMRDCFRRKERIRSKARHQPRMLRDRENWAKHVRSELAPVLDKGLHEPAPSIAVDAQGSLGVFKLAFQDNRRSIVKRVGERSRRMNPFQAVILQGERREEGRSNSKRIYRGSKIVLEARQG